MLEYELFFRNSMDMYVIATNDGYFKRVNTAFCNILGRSEAELLSRPFAELVHPDDLPKVDGALKNLSSGHPAFLVEMRLLASDGTYRNLQWTAYPDAQTGLLFVIARDYSAPFFDPHRMKLLLDSSPTAIFLVEHTGMITYSNHLAETIFGYQKNELIGKSIESLLPMKYRHLHQDHRTHYLLQPVLRPMGILPNLIGIRKNGQEFPIDVGLNPVWLDRGMLIICSVIDNSQKDSYVREAQQRLTKANTRLSRLADRDALTGLYNRRACERILSAALTEARAARETVSVIVADIDHFKQYNDSFGHPTGDEFLKHLSETMRQNIRQEDTIARLGGEEFLIILPCIDRDQAMRFGERLRRVVEQDPTAPHPATISLGAATHVFTSKRIAIKRVMKQMISEADQAMYESKKAGRNRFTHFTDATQDTSN